MLTSALTMLAKQGSADSKDDWRSFHFLRTLGRRNFQAQLKLDALFSPIGGPIFGTAFWRLFWGPCLNNSLAGSHFWFPIWDPKLAPRNCRKNDKKCGQPPAWAAPFFSFSSQYKTESRQTCAWERVAGRARSEASYEWRGHSSLLSATLSRCSDRMWLLKLYKLAGVHQHQPISSQTVEAHSDGTEILCFCGTYNWAPET